MEDIDNVHNKFYLQLRHLQEKPTYNKDRVEGHLAAQLVEYLAAINIDHLVLHNIFHQQFVAVNFNQWFGLQKSFNTWFNISVKIFNNNMGPNQKFNNCNFKFQNSFV